MFGPHDDAKLDVGRRGGSETRPYNYRSRVARTKRYRIVEPTRAIGVRRAGYREAASKPRPFAWSQGAKDRAPGNSTARVEVVWKGAPPAG